jgi:hypothetical protein
VTFDTRAALPNEFTKALANGLASEWDRDFSILSSPQTANGFAINDDVFRTRRDAKWLPLISSSGLSFDSQIIGKVLIVFGIRS